MCCNKSYVNMVSLSLSQNTLLFCTYSVELLGKETVHIPGRMQQHSMRFHHTTQNVTQFKTYQLLISGIFPWRFLDCSWLQVTETLENKTAGQEELLYKTLWDCAPGAVGRPPLPRAPGSHMQTDRLAAVVRVAGSRAETTWRFTAQYLPSRPWSCASKDRDKRHCHQENEGLLFSLFL